MSLRVVDRREVGCYPHRRCCHQTMSLCVVDRGEVGCYPHRRCRRQTMSSHVRVGREVGYYPHRRTVGRGLQLLLQSILWPKLRLYERGVRYL
jgi:hypothetical protein